MEHFSPVPGKPATIILIINVITILSSTLYEAALRVYGLSKGHQEASAQKSTVQ